MNDDVFRLRIWETCWRCHVRFGTCDEGLKLKLASPGEISISTRRSRRNHYSYDCLGLIIDFLSDSAELRQRWLAQWPQVLVSCS
jgi:hypothetical protein